MTPVVQHGLLVDTAAGMAYLYKNGVEHRDLKSANCLVTHDWRVKVGCRDCVHCTLRPHFVGNFRFFSLPLEAQCLGLVLFFECHFFFTFFPKMYSYTPIYVTCRSWSSKIVGWQTWLRRMVLTLIHTMYADLGFWAFDHERRDFHRIRQHNVQQLPGWNDGVHGEQVSIVSFKCIDAACVLQACDAHEVHHDTQSVNSALSHSELSSGRCHFFIWLVSLLRVYISRCDGFDINLFQCGPVFCSRLLRIEKS